MLVENPFSPSEIASNPADFFGRAQELASLARSLPQGSVAIRGPVGIGKSSLLAQARLLMEGFKSEQKSISVVAVGDKDVSTVDEAARLLLDSFISIDEKSKKVKFKLGSFFESESTEMTRYYADGRHLAILKRIVEEEYLKAYLADVDFLLLAIDEADKCPVPLARLIRSIATHTQQQGVSRRVRFVVAGVSPFFQRMVDEDPGINRFFDRTITLGPMRPEEATELIETKLGEYAVGMEEAGTRLEIDPTVIHRIIALSGGHPHVLQLMGSHMVESEKDDPDGIIDARDLLLSLRRICYEDRAWVYDAALHRLELHGRLEVFMQLLDLTPNSFPTRVDVSVARSNLRDEDIVWLVEHNVVSVPEPGYYGLVDEFLRIRILLDEVAAAEGPLIEREMLDWALSDGRLAESDAFLEDNQFWDSGESSSGWESEEPGSGSEA